MSDYKQDNTTVVDSNTASAHRGPAREFSEGSPGFDLMLKRGIDFMDYLIMWSGGGSGKYTDLDQQTALGTARAMAIALERNPDQQEFVKIEDLKKIAKDALLKEKDVDLVSTIIAEKFMKYLFTNLPAEEIVSGGDGHV